MDAMADRMDPGDPCLHGPTPIDGPPQKAISDDIARRASSLYNSRRSLSPPMRMVEIRNFLDPRMGRAPTFPIALPKLGATFWSAAFLFALLALGCKSAQFRAGQLPAQFHAAQKSADTTTLNLSRMASAGIGDSLIAPGDLLEISVATGRPGEDAKPQLARVGSDGRVEIAPIGTVEVGQLEAYDASQNIARASIERGIFLNPNVTVEVKQKAMNHISVLGAVEKPGSYEIPRGSSDLASAIAAAGGLAKEAGTRVEILRQSPTFLADANTTPAGEIDSQVSPAAYVASPDGPPGSQASGELSRMTRIDLASVPQGGDLSRLSEAGRVNDRDVVMVLPREKEVVHVAGLVREPGQFDLPHDRDVHLLDAVALAGGESSPVADKVLIIRRLPNREPVAIRASLYKAKRNNMENLRIAAGDTISIERTPATVVVDTLSRMLNISVGMAGRTTVF